MLVYMPHLKRCSPGTLLLNVIVCCYKNPNPLHVTYILLSLLNKRIVLYRIPGSYRIVHSQDLSPVSYIFEMVETGMLSRYDNDYFNYDL